jgi:DNA-binding response OmpR family regulator
MARILLVDDDDPFRKMLRLTLVKLEHDVVEAGNGREALKLQRAGGADLLLTDLVMPDQEGLETIQRFRREFPAVRIIAMSGGGRINARDFLKIAGLMGAGHTLTKPFATTELTAAIDRLLAGLGDSAAFAGQNMHSARQAPRSQAGGTAVALPDPQIR